MISPRHADASNTSRLCHLHTELDISDHYRVARGCMGVGQCLDEHARMRFGRRSAMGKTSSKPRTKLLRVCFSQELCLVQFRQMRKPIARNWSSPGQSLSSTALYKLPGLLQPEIRLPQRRVVGHLGDGAGKPD